MIQQLSPMRKTIVGIQFLFVAFGATVLMPLLVGLDPATAMFSAGVGTLIFHAVTKGMVPIFLGSSFAYIAPIILASKQWGLAGTMTGFIGVAVIYFIVSALIRWRGTAFLNRLFPPIVVGPTIVLIGLSLAPTAVNMAKENLKGDANTEEEIYKEFIKHMGKYYFGPHGKISEKYNYLSLIC